MSSDAEMNAWRATSTFNLPEGKFDTHIWVGEAPLMVHAKLMMCATPRVANYLASLKLAARQYYGAALLDIYYQACSKTEASIEAAIAKATPQLDERLVALMQSGEVAFGWFTVTGIVFGTSSMSLIKGTAYDQSMAVLSPATNPAIKKAIELFGKTQLNYMYSSRATWATTCVGYRRALKNHDHIFHKLLASTRPRNGELRDLLIVQIKGHHVSVSATLDTRDITCRPNSETPDLELPPHILAPSDPLRTATSAVMNSFIQILQQARGTTPQRTKKRSLETLAVEDRWVGQLVASPIIDSPVVEEQAPAAEEPVAVVEEPVAVVEEPIAVVEEPVAVVEEPVAVVEEPVAVVEEQAPAVEERTILTAPEIEQPVVDQFCVPPPPLFVETPTRAGKPKRRRVAKHAESAPKMADVATPGNGFYTTLAQSGAMWETNGPSAAFLPDDELGATLESFFVQTIRVDQRSICDKALTPIEDVADWQTAFGIEPQLQN